MVQENRYVDPLEAKAQKTAGALYSPEQIDRTILQTIKYEYPHRKINVEMVSDEFTCVCPFSGLPDFARLSIRYTPSNKLVEMKSLKYYLHAFRNVRIYNEHVINRIIEDLEKVLKPRAITIVGEFTSRGGIVNTVTASSSRKK